MEPKTMVLKAAVIGKVHLVLSKCHDDQEEWCEITRRSGEDDPVVFFHGMENEAVVRFNNAVRAAEVFQPKVKKDGSRNVGRSE